GVVNERHGRKQVINQTVSLRSVAACYQPLCEKKAQEFASPAQGDESRAPLLSPHCCFSRYEKRDTMNALLYGLVVVIWGTTWIAIFLQQGPVAAPVSIFWRFAVASAAMMIVLVALRRLRRLAFRDHLFCLLQGCCVFCFNFWCFYTAASYINTGLESVIFSMAVLYNALNSFLFFGQRPPARFYLAAAMGLLGIITLFWSDLIASGWSAGLLFGIALSALGTYGFSLGNMI